MRARVAVHGVLHAVAVCLLVLVGLQGRGALGPLGFQCSLGIRTVLLELLVVRKFLLRSLDKSCVVRLEGLAGLHFARALVVVHRLLQGGKCVAGRLLRVGQRCELGLAALLRIKVRLLRLPTCLVRRALGREVLLESCGVLLHLVTTAVRHASGGVADRGLMLKHSTRSALAKSGS